MPHLPVMEGYILLGGMGVVLIGASLADRLGVRINETAVKVVLGVVAIGGAIIGIMSSNFFGHVLNGF